jgi:hypothetical protein
LASVINRLRARTTRLAPARGRLYDISTFQHRHQLGEQIFEIIAGPDRKAIDRCIEQHRPVPFLIAPFHGRDQPLGPPQRLSMPVFSLKKHEHSEAIVFLGHPLWGAEYDTFLHHGLYLER